MAAVLFDLAFGLLLGFSLTIPPGPMNALIASQSVRSLRAGVTTGLGAMTADLVLGVLVFLLHSVVDLSSFLRWIDLLGAAMMVYLAIGLLRQSPSRVEAPVSSLGTFSKALGLGLSNPFQSLWWLTVGLAFAYIGGWILFVGLFGAIAVWIVAFPWLLRATTERRPGVARAVVVVSGGLLIGFAGYFLFLAAT